MLPEDGNGGLRRGRRELPVDPTIHCHEESQGRRCDGTPPDHAPRTSVTIDADVADADPASGFCAVCRIGRIGRPRRVLRWAQGHRGHTGHAVPVRALWAQP